MTPLATMLPTVLLLIAFSTTSGRFIAPEMLGEAQREVYDPYGQAGEQGALAAEELQRQEERILGEVQEYEEPLMSEIQAPCHNYHGYLAGNIRIAGTVCSSTSRDGCARILIGRRGLFGSMQLCHPDGGRTLCYKMGSGRVCAKHQHPWKSYPITVPTPLYPINMDVNVEDGICFNIPPFVRRC